MELTVEQALQQGITAHKEGKLQDAERSYRAILQSQPTHPDANHNLGVLAVSVNKTEAALPLFKAALEANSTIEQYWLSYIDALIKVQQLDNAKQVIEQAKKHAVDRDRLNSLAAQLSSKNLNPNTTTGSPPQELLDSLLEHYQNGRFAEAEKLSMEITQEFPKHQFAWKVLGAVLGATGRLDEAVDANRTAVALSPEDASAHSNLGVTLKDLGKLDEAEASYNQAIALKFDYAEAHYNLGNTLQELEKYDEAEVSHKQAIVLKPDFAQAHSNLGNTLNELKRLDEAEASYRKAIDCDAAMGEAYLGLSCISRQLGRVEESYDIYIKGLKLASNETVSKSNLETVIPTFAKKVQEQNGIPAFFDNNVISHLTKKSTPPVDYCHIFEQGQLSKENRFILFSERVKNMPVSMPSGRLFDGLPLSASQGIHSLIKWKEHTLYKTSFDLVLYWMIIQNVQPEVIIELGSGTGGSAIWLADMTNALGLNTHIYSYDIKKPELTHNRVTFIEYDLMKINQQTELPCLDLFSGRKILIEDAHVNVKNVLNFFDYILRKDDYLIVEDSESKQEIIREFAAEKDVKYKLDQYFLDFFGTNITCSKNSIFRVF